MYSNPLYWTDPYGLSAGSSAFSRALPAAGICAASDGPVPIGDIVAGVILIGALGYDIYNSIYHNEDGSVEVPIDELDPLHSPETIGDRPDIEGLSDDELLDAVRNPRDGDKLKKNTNSGKLMDGNTRAQELKKRASDPKSKISGSDTVPVIPYTPDNSDFWDL